MYLLLALRPERGSFTQCGYLFLCNIKMETKKAYNRLRLKGERFGRLVVLNFETVKDKRSYWRCQCDCGNYKTVRGDLLKYNKVKSCGCLKKETGLEKAKKMSLNNIKHGLCKSGFYKRFS